ncbi:uncharacterized protein EI97DRAFT_433573 [Westerdykella ornata]|uniref:Uncharacterized protein n=1 Tax=Westerdykella ornata TaxID=318751 RepID=A0A6A6JIW0_WESOR|nr:uncharacterized protein EI97DRAFT_433573 [Westerdykella ornata]KAF2276164.1 hypothetical protein EI97DRAFT_433573 [Westerdykella ornata]
MSPLKGFSDSAFSNYSDFKTACVALLRSLKPYQSRGGARIRLPLVTGTHFDDIAAQLEGYARPLWAVAALLHGGGLTEDEKTEIIEPYVQGLANGTDPNHAEYWGPVVVRDQRMVEMEIISFALLVAPEAMYKKQTPAAQRNIANWLGTINGKDFPITNWLWFRVMTNLALVKVCGMPYDDLKPSMASDLDQMEQFYLGEGWSADGKWDENGRQADYYSGSFAIQFSQLLYVKMAEDLDPARCARFRERAAAFANAFWLYFDSNGAAIPFGRSLTYRFAFAGFWSAVAFAGVELPAPLHDWGVVKGLLLRHFRWWSDKSDMFNIDGTLTIGFTYPNMYMSEDYNSPQSPYWAMKSFVALGLPQSHPFWTAEEKSLPQSNSGPATLIKPPMHILCDSGTHHFLLSAGQFCPWPLKATEAKYGKYAYSSHFGFSVPTGASVLAQIAPDSTLALSKDQGDTWRVPWKVHRYGFGKAFFINSKTGLREETPTLRSLWKPWRDAEIEVDTMLIAPCRRWKDWHVRIHKITNNATSGPAILATEGGFAIQGRGAKAGGVLPTIGDESNLCSHTASGILEGTLQSVDGALVCSNAGTSGVKPLALPPDHQNSVGDTNCEILKPDANTNLIWQRTLIPTVRRAIEPLSSGQTATFATAVFAIGRASGFERAYDELNIGAKWADVPVVFHAGDEVEGVGEYISFDWNSYSWQ